MSALTAEPAQARPGVAAAAALVRRPLWHVAGFSVLVNLLLLTPALFMLQVFDRVLTSQSRETLLVLLLGMAIALLLLFLFDQVRARLHAAIGHLLGDLLSPLVAQALLSRSLALGEPAPRQALRDVTLLRGLFSAQGLLALFDAPWAVIFVAVIWLAHPLLGIAAAGAALLMLALAFATDRLTRRGIESLQAEAAEAGRELEAALHNAEVTQALGMGPAVIARWQRRNDALATRLSASTGCSASLAALARAMRQAIQALMLALGAYLVITRQATPGIMIASTVLLGRALAPVEQVVASWRSLVEGRGALARVRALLAAAEAGPARMALPAPAGRLEARNLAWRLPGSDRLVLSAVSLELERGESLAVTGASAAGKSTLLRLLAGLLKPSAGWVGLDGADLAQWPREALGPSIGYVPQDVELFSGSVAENIARLGTVDAQAVVRAARRARVHELILALPQGYDTEVGPQSRALSPGQRQRIALARALYGDPRLLLLDEPNANLDGAGEQALAEALRELRGDVTVVVVTHRGSLVQHIDKMLVLEAGRVLHQGSTAEVLRALRTPAGAAHGAQVVPMRPAAGAKEHAP